MKEVPKKQDEEVGGGILYEPWCPPPGDLGYPQLPGCPAPTDPPPDPVFSAPAALL